MIRHPITNEEMSHQQVFDFVTRKLHEQGKSSIFLETRACKYRLGELRCAVGWLIPDDKYVRQMDEGNLMLESIIDRWFPEWKRDTNFLCNLQSVHDLGRVVDHDFRLATNENKSKFNDTRWDAPWYMEGIASRLSRFAASNGLNSQVVSECWPQ